jgi:hypothetical protein
MKYQKQVFFLALLGVFIYSSKSRALSAQDESNDAKNDLLTISLPNAGLSIHTGEHFTVDVIAKPSSGIKTVFVGGKGISSDPQSGPPFSFDLVAPTDVSSKISIVAIGSTQPGQLGSIISKPVIVDVQVNNDGACVLNELPMPFKTFTLAFVGQQLSFDGVSITCSDGRIIDVTNSGATEYTSGDNSVMSVDSRGIVTAIGPGQTQLCKI